MNYYQELGVRPTATIREIRQAYKVLARLVHPDGQPDGPLRQMAQRQMQRLNEILDILSHAEKRRAYDAGLSAPRLPAVRTPWPPGRKALRVNPAARPWRDRSPGWLRAAVRNWFWISLLLVLAGLGVWYAAQDKPPSPDAASSNPPAPDAQPAVPPKPPGRRANPPAVRQRTPRIPAGSGAPPPKKAPEPPADLSWAPETPPAGAMHPQAVPWDPADLPPAAAAPPAENPSFAGSWLYAPDPAEKARPGTYPATYVELLLTEEHGHLAGTYRARYQVPDRAVFPEVSLQLEGDALPGNAAHLQWTSASRARGEMELLRDGPHLLKVSWWTTGLGRRDTLASGTARLIRRREP